MPAPDPHTILEALSHAIAGNPQRGLELIQPIVDAGPRSTYALLGALAETASKDVRDANGPGTLYGLDVQSPDGPADVDLLPPHLKFAARFVTAWANRDQDTAAALFWAVAERSDRSAEDLADAITAVFAMAAAVAEYEVIKQRRNRAEESR
ncbi:hypothetical protein ACFWXA_13140 [Streptomyces atroolivaceus]|uniref:hypothetical protein n=1 Tax=Streptomyces atroolivaceus TaxID=66869 RepID=UPI00365CAFC1